MSALVTGGAGFIGRHLVAELLATGQAVRVMDDLSRARPGSLDEFIPNPGFLGLVNDDVATPGVLERAATGMDVIFHLAASVAVGASVQDPAAAIRTNVLGTLAVLEAARNAGLRVVVASTCHVYAPASDPLDEEATTGPLSPYAASKLAADVLGASYQQAYGVRLTIVRPFNTYGPWQRDDLEGGVVARFMQAELAGEPLQVYGDGAQTRDFVFVTDCARGIALAASAPATGLVLNLATGVETSIARLAYLIARRSDVAFVPHPHPNAEVPRYVGAALRARAVLGWAPQVDLAEGLRRTRAWFARLPEA